MTGMPEVMTKEEISWIWIKPVEVPVHAPALPCLPTGMTTPVRDWNRILACTRRRVRMSHTGIRYLTSAPAPGATQESSGRRLLGRKGMKGGIRKS